MMIFVMIFILDRLSHSMLLWLIVKRTLPATNTLRFNLTYTTMIVSIGNMEKDNIANQVKARDHDTVVLDELQYKSPDFWDGFEQYMRELIQNGMAEPVVKITSHHNDDAWNRHR